MKAFRYNSKKREDRKFNTTGKEKNPNKLNYFASNMKYAEHYKYIYDETGELKYECELEIVDIENVNLFDMNKFYNTTKAYRVYIYDTISTQLKDYSRFLNEAKTKKDKKLWTMEIEKLSSREAELVSSLFSNEFQELSDFEYQNVLVAELKSKEFDGYFTANEIVLF
ncbi:MAG: hypothetical protein RR319_01185 [Bacteroides sp.]